MKLLTITFVAIFLLTANLAQKDYGIPPSIVEGPPKNLICRTYGTVTLNCRGTGVPNVIYEWKKDGRTLDLNLQNIHKGLHGTITIRPVRALDEGFYQCFAGNHYGRAISNTTHLQRMFLDDIARNYSNVRNITVQEGYPFNITCDPPFSGFPKPTYIWEVLALNRNVSRVMLSKRIQIAENGDLHFGQALPEDGLGFPLYRCSAHNRHLDVKIGGYYTRVTVIPIDSYAIRPGQRIGFTSATRTVAVVGRGITLACFFYGMPEPTTLWSGPDNRTLPTGRYALGSYTTTLTIFDISASDEGQYECYVNAVARVDGVNAKKLDVIVEAAPVFRTVNNAPYDVDVPSDTVWTFNCEPEAKPAAKIVWLRDGKELDPYNPPERFQFGNRNRSLTIRDVCRDCVDRERKTDLMVIQCNASNVHGYAFAQGYVNVLSTFCDYQRDEDGSIIWNRTLAGKETLGPCPANTTGMGLRKCVLKDGTPTWDKPNYNGCFDKEFSDLLKRVVTVEKSVLKNQSVIAKIANELSDVTNRSDGLSAGNLNASVMLINRLAELRNGSALSTNSTEIKSIVQATSNVLQSNNSVAWKKLEAVDRYVATGILSSVDIYGRSLSTTNTSKYNTEDADNIVLEAWSFDKSADLPIQLEFPSGSLWGEASGDKISVSMETLQSSISSERRSTVKVWGSYYRTVNDYLPGNGYSFNEYINSRVLSFSIDGLKPKEKLRSPVLITLQHNKEEGMEYKRFCTFWNFDRDEWDSTGCSVNSTNSTHTICSCDHLTNFAILMSRNPSNDKALSILSIIGCSISVIALILTVLVYALTWKQSKSAQATVLLNLCVALIIAYIIFMAGADKVDPKDGCTAVAVLLHYFFLAAFFIMLAEGVELLLYIIFVFHVRTTTETVILVVAAWVLPLIVVAVSLGSTRLRGYGSNQACWLSVDNHLIWAFFGPVLFVITVNFVILILVLRWMSQKRTLIANNAKKRDEIRATIWNLLVTCPVLGLGWLFGVLSIAFDYPVFQYLFVIANSLQGLLIFIFHALFHNKKMNERISSVYTNYIGRCRKSELSVSTQMTSATDQQTRKTDKAGFVPRAVKHYEELGKQEELQRSGKRLTRIEDDDSEKM